MAASRKSMARPSASAADLKPNLDHADEVAESIKATIDKYIASKTNRRPHRAPLPPPLAPPIPSRSN